MRTHATQSELSFVAGDIPCENSLLRQVSSLLRRLPAIESGKFQDDFLMVIRSALSLSLSLSSNRPPPFSACELGNICVHGMAVCKLYH